jgi:ribonucleotide reductase beta subunit family protein with ferritin-like domain
MDRSENAAAPCTLAAPCTPAAPCIPTAPPAATPPAAAPPATESAFAWEAGERERVALFPIRHPDIWAFRKKLEALHWNAQEVDLTHDKKDWERMSGEQRHFVKMQLAFFATVDIDVLKNLDENFGEEVDCMEARMVYAAQKDQECVHAEAYGLQIEAVMDGAERAAVLNAVRTMPVIALMRAWVLRWFDRGVPLGERLVAFAAVEGVLFSASFSALQWLRELNLLPGITDYNSFIARDEGVHTAFACLLARRYLRTRPAPARARAIFEDIVRVLDAFVEESLPVRLIGMNAGLMCQYVRFQADCVLHDLGYEPAFLATNPFRFMDKLTLNEVAKVNFFEARPTQYQNPSKAGAFLLAVDASPVDY